LTVLAQPETAFNVIHTVPIGRLGHLDGSAPSGGGLRGRLSLGLRGALRTLRRLLHATRGTTTLAAFATTVRTFTPLAGAPTGFFTRRALLALRTLSPRFTNFTNFARHGALTRSNTLTDSARIAIATSAPAAVTASRALSTVIASAFGSAFGTPFLTPIIARTLFRALRASIAARSGCRGFGRGFTDVGIQLG
jgi:hypothetical protein